MRVQARENRSLHAVRDGLKKRDAERRNAKPQGQSPGRGHRDSDSCEASRPHSDADGVKIAPGDARSLE